MGKVVEEGWSEWIGGWYGWDWYSSFMHKVKGSYWWAVEMLM